MSYLIRVYAGNSTVSNINVYVSSQTNTNVGYLGVDGNGDDNYWETKGFTNNAKFTATVNTGYTFSRWAYREGSLSGALNYSYSNPFTYTGKQNIYIRAETTTSSGGGDGETDITWTYRSCGSWGPGEPLELTMNKTYYLYRMQIYLDYSGITTFYTTGSIDTVGYISKSKEYDEKTGEPVDYIAYDDDSGSGNNFKITCDLNADDKIYLWIRSYTGLETGDITLYIDGATEPEISVQKWSWTDSNGTATTNETINAKTAISNGGAVSNFSYKVWNDMCDKVAAIIDAENDAWYEDYDSIANTKIASSDKTLYAGKFNSLRFNIGARANAPSTGIVEKSPGDVVVGDFFITLADCINSWIDNLQ